MSITFTYPMTSESSSIDMSGISPSTNRVYQHHSIQDWIKIKVGLTSTKTPQQTFDQPEFIWCTHQHTFPIVVQSAHSSVHMRRQFVKFGNG